MNKEEKKIRKEKASKAYIEEMLNRPSGVFCLKNTDNGKIYVDYSVNITSKLNRLMVQLKNNSMFSNKQLQDDFNHFGEEVFEFEILEEIKKTKDDDVKVLKKQAEQLYNKWLEKLEPYEDKGYNKKKSIKRKEEKLKVNREGIQLFEDTELEDIEKEVDYYSIKDISTLFWNASINELKKGYIIRDGKYICLVCGKFFDENQVYPIGRAFYNAKKAIEEHIMDDHGSMFDVLLNMDKKYTGLSQIQSDLIKDFYMGLDDDSIAKKANIAKSTVRNHRFRLKEKQKQAKVFLSLMSIVEERQNEEDSIIDIHKTPRMLDERYAITKDYQKKVLEKFIDKDGKLKVLPKKEKDKIIILFHFASQFVYNRKYDEAQVNSIIKAIYSDFVTIRRYLIEYGFMERTKDGSSYWVV